MVEFSFFGFVRQGRIVCQPRHPSDRRACWVLWDLEERVVESRKTEYDRLQAEMDMVRAGLPVEAAISARG